MQSKIFFLVFNEIVFTVDKYTIFLLLVGSAGKRNGQNMGGLDYKYSNWDFFLPCQAVFQREQVEEMNRKWH